MFKKVTFTISMLVMANVAYADDWGCTVLLCLASPTDPMAIADCVAPLKKLYRFLDDGGSMPTCDTAGDEKGGHRSWAQVVDDPYDPCPAGLQPATRGMYVVQGHLKTSDGSRYQRYILEGSPAQSEFRGGNRACVGHYVGQYRSGTWDNYDDIFVFNKVIWQVPQPPRAIDVYIDGKFDHRVRW